MLLLSTAACSGATQTDSEDSESGTTAEIAAKTTAEAEPELPSYDYDGAEFNLFVRTERLYYLDSDAYDGDVFNDSVFARNAKVEELCNIKLNYIDAAREKMSAMIKSSVMAGDGAYDLVMPDYSYIDPTSGLYINLLSLGGLDFSQSWW